MKMYTSIPHTSPLQFYGLLQASYPSYAATHDAATNRVTATGEAWHWSAAMNLTENSLTVIGTYKGAASDYRQALNDFQQALDAQQFVYLIECEQPTAYGHHSEYIEHADYKVQLQQERSMV